MTIQNLVRALLLGAFAVATCPAAAIFAGDYSGGGTPWNFSSATGYYFTPNQDITVVQLGIYDISGTGFSSGHNVGIFLTDGTPVVTAAIGAGTANPFVAGTVGGTRVVDIASTLLTGGTGYYILGDNFSVDQYVYGLGSVIFDAAITWNGYGTGGSNDIFSAANNFGGLPGNLGPNFAFELGDTTVPEPASVLLCATGLLALVLRRRIAA